MQLKSSTSTRNLQSSLKGSTRLSSRIFRMTSTLAGGLFQVSRWLAGSWMCLQNKNTVIKQTFCTHTNNGNNEDGRTQTNNRVRCYVIMVSFFGMAIFNSA